MTSCCLPAKRRQTLKRRLRPLKLDPEVASDPVRIEAAAVRHLARRDHSAGELCDKLVSRGYDRDVVSMVVTALTEAGLQSDERFIEAFVAARVGRGQGPVRIAQDLRKRGIPAEKVEDALARVDDWVARAVELRRKRFGNSVPGSWDARGKQARFLQQRGFTGEQVHAALDGKWDEEA